METRGSRRSPSPWPHGRRVRAPPRSLREGIYVRRRLARHALAERVALVVVRAVELLEGLALMGGREPRVRPLGGALLRRVLERRHLLGVVGILGGLPLMRLDGHALAVGVPAVLVGSVELLERLAVVRSGEVGVRPLRLAVLRRALEGGLLLGVLLRRVLVDTAAEAVVLRLEGLARSLRLAALGLALLDRSTLVGCIGLGHGARG